MVRLLWVTVPSPCPAQSCSSVEVFGNANPARSISLCKAQPLLHTGAFWALLWLASAGEGSGMSLSCSRKEQALALSAGSKTVGCDLDNKLGVNDVN